MAERIDKAEFARRLAIHMNTDEATAARWVDGFIETAYDTFKGGEGITLQGLGGFYLEHKRDTWAFKFNPAQRLRALFGWSSTYQGKP